MRKTGRPWYRKQRDAWYVQIDGQQIILAKGHENKAEAYARYAALLGAGPVATPQPAGVTLCELVEAFKAHCKGRLKPATLASYSSVLSPLTRQLADSEAIRAHGKQHSSACSPYGVRPWAGATVSTPLKWAEVKKGLDPSKFTIKTMPKRLEKVGDLWQRTLGPGIDLLDCLERLSR
jgi:hypothetical protein